MGDLIGEVIGPYKLLQVIGEGGFGVVYLAEQRRPIRRRVALKVIKLGMDTNQVIARFEAERQALAMMDHPHIAKVLDAGSTDNGRPYFVMEFVSGEPIVEYCNAAQLNTRERLELFTSVCQAIQHAHQKGVIHRDIKPGNVLVKLQDAVPVPKVIDFGLAKALNVELTQKTLVTGQQQIIGTPAYMSPEQAKGSGLDIDTRTDIYSLGVLLYELLAGTTPFDAWDLINKGYAEFVRVICEEEPIKPSTRLSSIKSDITTSSDSKSALDTARLSLQLKGDLDWIVMKCLEKERSRRYETVDNLAADIQRHLHDEPVLAGPPGTRYRLEKFVRRNRGKVIAATSLTAVLILGIIGTSIGLIWALTQKHRAEMAETEMKKRADELQQVTEFQENQLSELDVPLMATRLRDNVVDEAIEAWRRERIEDSEIESNSKQLEQLLAGANFTDVSLATLYENVFERALQAAEEFDEQPLVKAQLQQALANTLQGLGLLEQATRPQTEALETRRRLLGNEHPDTLYSLEHMGRLWQSQSELNKAEACFREALAGRRRSLGEEHPDTYTSINSLAWLLQIQGKLDESEKLYLKVLDGRRRVLGNNHVDTLATMNNLGWLLQNQGKLTESELYYEEALEGLRRIHGENHKDVLTAIHNMGSLLGEQGKFEKAEDYLRKALAGCRDLLGNEHPSTMRTMNDLGVLLVKQGKPKEAEPLFRESLRLGEKVLGKGHRDTLSRANNLAFILESQGNLTEAERIYRQVLQDKRRMLDGADDVTSIRILRNLSANLFKQNRFAEADPYFREAVDKSRQELGEDHGDTLSAINNMAVFLQRQGKLAEAEPFYVDALEGFTRVLGKEHPSTLLATNNMGFLRQSQGRFAEAEPYYVEALQGAREVLGDQHPTTLDALQNLGRLMNEMERFTDAEPLLGENLKTRTDSHGKEDWRVAKAQSILGESLAGQQRFAAAEPLLNQGFTGLEANIPATKRDKELTEAIERLVRLYEAWGKPKESGDWRTRLESIESNRNDG